jgi:hypothetical protein
MSNNNSRNSARAQVPAPLRLGPEMKASMLEWYEYHVRADDTPPAVSIVVTLADIMANNHRAKAYRDIGALAFGIISIPFLPLVEWVRAGGETQIELIADDFGPANCGLPLCSAVLAEFFRDIRATAPELLSIHSRPLPKWMTIPWKGRADCTGCLPIEAVDSIH